MIHHLAVAPKNFWEAHKFYTEAMGFEVVKAVKRQAVGGPQAGWTKHVFYDTGGAGGLFALWDLHLADLGDDWLSSVSTGLGLPFWINHFAFEVADLDELEERKQRWLAYGLKVLEMDHGFIRSIYTRDPDDNFVEWTCRTRPLGPEDHAEALEILADDTPATIAEYEPEVFLPPATAS